MKFAIVVAKKYEVMAASLNIQAVQRRSVLTPQVALLLFLFASTYASVHPEPESEPSCSMTYMWPNFIPINFTVTATATQAGQHAGTGASTGRRDSPQLFFSADTGTGTSAAASAASSSLPYRLLLYREGYHPPDPARTLQSLAGVPVIYVPGSGGSYLQVSGWTMGERGMLGLEV